MEGRGIWREGYRETYRRGDKLLAILVLVIGLRPLSRMRVGLWW